MDTLRPGLDLDAFFRTVEAARSRVLLLDYDGTLAPFREARDEAVPYPGLRALVAREVRAGDTRVVVVSGRAVEDVRPLLGVEPPPEIWGNHGWERLTPEGALERQDPGAEARRRLDIAREAATERAPASRVEVKPVSVAVHDRGLGPEEAERLLADVQEAWEPLVEGGTVELHDFDGGLELRVPGRDKGTAVRAILADEPEDAVVAYLGDDRTDEDAFRELGRRQERLAPTPGGPRVLRVLVRERPRETEADLRLTPPDELGSFLERWRRAAAGRSESDVSDVSGES